MRCKWIKMIMVAMGIFVLLTSCRLLPKEEEVTPVPSLSDAVTSAQTPKKIGISLPTISLPRWEQDGKYMKERFEEAGYAVELHYAGDNEIPLQVSALENMMSAGCDLLIIGAINEAIDGGVLNTVLDSAKSKGIPVIAYDRLIWDTDAVTCFATFANWEVGGTQGKYITDQLGLEKNEGPFNIEFFIGDLSENSPYFFMEKAFEVLQPYLDNGKLVCPSGQTERSQTAIESWSSDNAQARMEELIQSNQYAPTKTKLDAVYCMNDSIAQGVTAALLDAGYTPENFPLITGMDCDIASVRNILAGTQSMSVFKLTSTLCDQTVAMATALLNGNEPEVNDVETYDNGTGIIPTYLCDPVIVTKENYREILIDSGYYTEKEITD